MSITINTGRSQVTSVNGVQGDVVIGGANLYSSVSNKHYAVNNAGVVSTSELSWSTDYMDCSGIKCLTAQAWAKVDALNTSGEGIYLHISYYTAEKTFIRKDFVNTHIVTDYIDHVSLLSIPPRNAKYFIGGIITDKGAKLRDESLKIEIGTVPTDWSPAPEDYLGSFNAYNITQMHRNLFRGKNLGTTFTAEQKAAIAAGTWDDLYLGDYWTINNHTWRIADFDYWLGKGDTSCAKHHIVVVPDDSLYTAQMHNTDSGAAEITANTTKGGYFNSDMRTTNLTGAKTLIETDFGTGAILKHRSLLTNAVKDGYPSGGTWCDSEVDLMNEMMVYGAYHFAPRGNGTIVPYNYTAEYTQLALFQVAPYYIIPNRPWYWLRDVVSATYFALVGGRGDSYCDGASYVWGVRPAVGIVGS